MSAAGGQVQGLPRHGRRRPRAGARRRQGGPVQPALPARHRPARELRQHQGDPPPGGADPDRAPGPRDRGRRGARDPEGERLMADETTTRPTTRKVREGIVTSTVLDKTAVVTVTTRKPHPLYKKSMLRSKKLYVHDEGNETRVGDRVRVQETRPLSKLKRWRLVEILERAR